MAIILSNFVLIHVSYFDYIFLITVIIIINPMGTLLEKAVLVISMWSTFSMEVRSYSGKLLLNEQILSLKVDALLQEIY